MCGRYVSPDDAAMEREYHIGRHNMGAWIAKAFKQNHNTCPTHTVPILRVVRETAGEREILPMHWGLIPPWANGVQPKYSTINAMAESIDTKPTYRSAWKRGQRCVFPTRGFYEWQVLADGTKQPYFIQSATDGELFSIGGLWESSRTETGEEVLSCTIITMPANELMADIHNAKQRMPLILHKEDITAWLSGSVDDAKKLLQPYPSELMRAHKVSKRVNTPKNNDEQLMMPIEQ